MGDFGFEQSLKHWVDDALMAIFFFVVGLEIKREFIVGELSTLRGAALPVVAAIGGMVVPAAIYTALNAGGPGAAGWGVPMATDIAFALGVLALLGSRIPDALKVFLTALAIADDIGAILVIAIFYTQQVYGAWLLFALVPLALMIVLNRMGYDEPLGYAVLGVVLWFCVFNSGIHATIAGVIAAFTIPASAKMSPLAFTEVCRLNVDEIEAHEVPGAHTLEDDNQQRAALRIRDAAVQSTAPLQRLEFALHPLAVWSMLPLFALANANIRIVGIAGAGGPRRGGGRVPRPGRGQAARDLARLISGGANGVDDAAGRRHVAPHHRGGPSRRHRLHHVALRRQPRLPSGRSGERGQDRHPRCIGCGRGSRLFMAAFRDSDDSN